MMVETSSDGGASSGSDSEEDDFRMEEVVHTEQPQERTPDPHGPSQVPTQPDITAATTDTGEVSSPEGLSCLPLGHLDDEEGSEGRTPTPTIELSGAAVVIDRAKGESDTEATSRPQAPAASGEPTSQDESHWEATVDLTEDPATPEAPAEDGPSHQALVSCLFCPEEHQVEEMQSHLDSVHTCPACEELVANVDDHMREAHPDRLRCPICNELFPTIKEQEDHLWEHDETGDRAEDDARPREACPICSASFADLSTEQRQDHEDFCGVARGRKRPLKPRKSSRQGRGRGRGRGQGRGRMTKELNQSQPNQAAEAPEGGADTAEAETPPSTAGGGGPVEANAEALREPTDSTDGSTDSQHETQRGPKRARSPLLLEDNSDAVEELDSSPSPPVARSPERTVLIAERVDSGGLSGRSCCFCLHSVGDGGPGKPPALCRYEHKGVEAICHEVCAAFSFGVSWIRCRRLDDKQVVAASQKARNQPCQHCFRIEGCPERFHFSCARQLAQSRGAAFVFKDVVNARNGSEGGLLCKRHLPHLQEMTPEWRQEGWWRSLEKQNWQIRHMGTWFEDLPGGWRQLAHQVVYHRPTQPVQCAVPAVLASLGLGLGRRTWPGMSSGVLGFTLTQKAKSSMDDNRQAYSMAHQKACRVVAPGSEKLPCQACGISNLVCRCCESFWELLLGSLPLAMEKKVQRKYKLAAEDLPEALDHPDVEVRLVAPGDARRHLTDRREYAVVASRTFLPGDVIMPCQGIICTLPELRDTVTDLCQGDDLGLPHKEGSMQLPVGYNSLAEWRAEVLEMTQELEDYNSNQGKDMQRLVASSVWVRHEAGALPRAYFHGNPACLIKDPTVNIHRHKLWRLIPMAEGKLEHVGVQVVSHFHQPSTFGNVKIVNLQVCGLVLPFVVAAAEIPAGDELLMHFGLKFWKQAWDVKRSQPLLKRLEVPPGDESDSEELLGTTSGAAVTNNGPATEVVEEFASPELVALRAGLSWRDIALREGPGRNTGADSLAALNSQPGHPSRPSAASQAASGPGPPPPPGRGQAHQSPSVAAVAARPRGNPLRQMADPLALIRPVKSKAGSLYDRIQ